MPGRRSSCAHRFPLGGRPQPRGIYWGLRLIEKDEEIRRESGLDDKLGANTNPKAFLLISDGQSWSGPLIRSTLDRAELTRIATAGGGRYFEIDRDSDRVALALQLTAAAAVFVFVSSVFLGS